jgi:hypothetical protein
MNIQDYLLNIDDLDWGKMFKDWKWLIQPGTDIQPWLMNAFGDLFWIDENASVCLLNITEGSNEVLAESEDDFLSQAEDEENASNWLLLSLVEELKMSKTRAKLGQCFGFKLLPVLGGDYDVSNIYTSNIAEYWAFCGDVHRQLSGLPDGAPIDIKFKSRKEID